MIVDRDTLLRYLPGQPATNIAVYVQAGADAAKVRRDLEARLRDYPLMLAPNDLLRRAAVEVFDRTFAVTYALEAVAIVVAMLGAANSLLALVCPAGQDAAHSPGMHPSMKRTFRDGAHRRLHPFRRA